MTRAGQIRAALAPALATLGLLLLVVAVVVTPVALTQSDPLGALGAFVLGPFDDRRHIGNIIETATPLLFTGLAVCVMFRAGMLNFGAEGAFFLGGVAATYAIFHLPGPAMFRAAEAIAFGAVVGSMACAIPGLLRAKFGASELVSSLMLNYAVLYLGLYVVNYVLRDPNAGAMASYRLPPEAKLPRLVLGTHVTVAALVGLAACGLGGVWLFFTRWGYEARIVGANPGFARHIGLRVAGIAAGAQFLGGLAAAAGGAMEVQGMYLRFTWDSLPGQGWNGLVVAILAGNNPFLVPLAALALSWLQVGGDQLARNYDVPSQMVGLIQALVILFATAAAITQNPRLRAWLAGHAKAAT